MNNAILSTAPRSERLLALENTADRYLSNIAESWVNLATTIKTIQDEGEWKLITPHWKDYVEGRFGISYGQLRQYTRCASLAQQLMTLNLYFNEGTLRVLKRDYSDDEIFEGAVGVSQAFTLLGRDESIAPRHIKSAIGVNKQLESTGYVDIEGEPHDPRHNPRLVAIAESITEADKRMRANRNKNRAYIQATVTAQAGKTLTLQLPDDSLVFGAGEQITIIVEVIE